jgi:serine/threonine-protein kinase RsbW
MVPEPIPSCEFVTDKLKMKLNVTFRAKIDAISPTVERIMTIVSEMACAEGREFEIQTALQESIANAVIHGAKGDGRKRIRLTVMCDEERGMLISVRDPGKGFDPSSVASPIVGENIFSSHGRGIFLLNQLMDEVIYRRGGTEIHMRKK